MHHFKHHAFKNIFLFTNNLNILPEVKKILIVSFLSLDKTKTYIHLKPPFKQQPFLPLKKMINDHTNISQKGQNKNLQKGPIKKMTRTKIIIITKKLKISGNFEKSTLTHIYLTDAFFDDDKDIVFDICLKKDDVVKVIKNGKEIKVKDLKEKRSFLFFDWIRDLFRRFMNIMAMKKVK